MIQNRSSLISVRRKTRPIAPGVKFLTASGQSAKGMYDTFKRLADQMLYQTRYMNPYMQSHPMPSERVAALEGLARASPYWDTRIAGAAGAARSDAGQAVRLYGAAGRGGRRYPPSDSSLPARYARAIASYRFSEARGPTHRSTPLFIRSHKIRISMSSRARLCWKRASRRRRSRRCGKPSSSRPTRR